MARKIILSPMLIFAITCFSPQSGKAQTIEGGCSTVTVTSTPYYQGNLYIGCSYLYVEQCAAFIWYCWPRQAEYLLQRFTSSWVSVGNWQTSPYFTGITTHGTYRVEVRIPVVTITNVCPDGGLRKVFNYSNQHVGYIGEWSYMYSNTAIVGNTVPADNSGYSLSFFVDGGGGNSAPNGFDYGEIVTIDASGSQNYDQWWLAIIEYGGQGRYQSNEWQSGTVGLFNLSDLWKKSPHDGWVFESNTSYIAQFVVENSKCPNASYWNVKNPYFFICPPGSGCRFGEEVAPGAAISPNPASNSFQLVNFELSPEQEYKLTISDLSGKEVKSLQGWTNERTDVSNLPSGMYILNLLGGGKRLFTDKLVVNH